jgi:hypothetical protein
MFAEVANLPRSVRPTPPQCRPRHTPSMQLLPRITNKRGGSELEAKRVVDNLAILRRRFAPPR